MKLKVKPQNYYATKMWLYNFCVSRSCCKYKKNEEENMKRNTIITTALRCRMEIWRTIKTNFHGGKNISLAIKLKIEMNACEFIQKKQNNSTKKRKLTWKMVQSMHDSMKGLIGNQSNCQKGIWSKSQIRNRSIPALICLNILMMMMLGTEK